MGPRWTGQWEGAGFLRAVLAIRRDAISSVTSLGVAAWLLPLWCHSRVGLCGTTGWSSQRRLAGADLSGSMTQAVQWPQHLCVIREAWQMGIRRPLATDATWTFEDYREEVFRMGTKQQWPIHVVVWIPPHSPPNWKALVSSRLVSSLGPQLDAGGFLARPLCLDNPFIFLLWPQDCTWSRWSPTEYILPLRARIGAVLFSMLLEAYHVLWPNGFSELTWLPGQPALADLIPDLKVFRHPPEPR